MIAAAFRGAGVLGGGLAVALLPLPAAAHLVGTRFGDFYAGALHPITALEHLVPWLAMGILAGSQGSAAGRRVLLAFPLGTVVGVALAWMLPEAATWTRAANTGSFVLLGALIAIAWPLPLMAVSAIAASLGIVHGYGNGLAMSSETNLVLFLAGVTSAGTILVSLTAATTVELLRWRSWARTAVRAAGSWIFAVGLMMAGLLVSGLRADGGF